MGSPPSGEPIFINMLIQLSGILYLWGHWSMPGTKVVSAEWISTCAVWRSRYMADLPLCELL